MADAPKLLGTDTLRQAYPKFNQAIDNANEALGTANTAKSTADTAKSTADTALANSESTQNQLDAVVIDGDSSPMIAQALADTPYTTLKQKHDAVDAQLADGAKKLNTSTQTQRPLVVFISDDGKIGEYTTLAPVFESRGVPCNFALITSKIDTEGFMSTAQLQELANKGHGFLSHTHNHSELINLTEQQLHDDFSTSRDKLIEVFGSEDKVSSVAYPYGRSNETVVKVAREYFKAGYATMGEGYLLNDHVLDQYVIPRDGMIYDMGANPRTLDNMKPIIDRAKNENKLLVYVTHAAEFVDYPNNIPLLESLLDYIIASGISIVTHDVAIKEKGNTIDIGTFKTPYFKVGKAGYVRSSNLEKNLDLANSYNSKLTVDANTPLTTFKEGEITKNIVYNAQATGFPNNSAGTLFTYYNLANSDMNFQYYYPQGTTSFYRRDWNRYSNVWGTWKEFKQHSTDIFDTVSRNNATPLTSFPVGITYSKIATASATGFPLNVAGLLITYYVWEGTDMNFQIFHASGSNSQYKRLWNRYSSVWGAWKEFAPIA